ncbi:hypothetical protein E1211_22090 [Micromonospora sp. 15K316]|uniref:hypothetical protein n=1 Tax=Micromonospora sp. 15K316 TaxID=2530376 RepID=UPI001048E75D|nr:hypothetical protein [Micromonospora sp. 15K316]TDC31678.1 hypothetical protein E1211_22090 [Micromonospora sp. 15K316]
MDQTYRNCGTSALWVTAGYSKGNSRYAYIGYCAYVQPGQQVTWNFASTAPNSSYSTMICEQQVLEDGPGDSDCWTTPVPGSPQGGEMYLFYKNCSGHSSNVIPGYYKGNTYHAYVNNGWAVPDQSAIWWHFPSTVQNAQYETMFAL